MVSILFLAFVLLLASIAPLQGSNATEKCYSYEATGLFILDPKTPGVNVYPVTPQESPVPPYRIGAGLVAEAVLTSKSNTKSVFRGMVFMTNNASVGHYSVEFEFLPGVNCQFAGSLINIAGKVDFGTGIATAGISGGTGAFARATGTVTFSRLTDPATGQKWQFQLNFCVPEQKSSTHVVTIY